MAKKSTLLFVSIFVLLFIGVSDYGYGCHKNNLTHGRNPVPCDPEPPEPPPDDGGNTGTPVVVTFDDWPNDSIKSDDPGGHQYEHEGTKTGVTAILDHKFDMILRAGGIRALFIDFGKFEDNGDFLDDSGNLAECPFPSRLRTAPDSCSALVQAALTEHDAFDDSGGIPDPGDIHVHVQDMYPGDPCPAEDCGGPVIKVRPFQEYDIAFNVPRPKGNKSDSWTIAFSAKQENCLLEPPPAGYSFPDFLSIRAIDMVAGVGGALGADTWHIGTFDETGRDNGRLACLLKSKTGGPPTEFVGFFIMSFMYTIEIIQPEP